MLPFSAVVQMDVAQQAHVQAHAEVRGRTGNDVTALETELTPQLRYDLIWQSGQTHAVALYQPRLIYTHTYSLPTINPNEINPEAINRDDPNAQPTSAVHNVGAGIELVRNRWRLTAYQYFAYGPITTTALLVQPPWGGDELPLDPNPIVPSTVAVRFRVLFAQTQIFLPIRVSRRVSVTPGFVYNAFGGADESSRGAMAMTYGPGANVVVEVAATRNDRFLSTVGAGTVSTLFQGGRQGALIYRAEATEAWRHWFSDHVSTEVMGGGTIGGDRVAGYSLYSEALAALRYDTYDMAKLAPGAPPAGVAGGSGARWQLGVVAKAQPWLDIFSGELEQRAVGVLATNLSIDRVTLRAEGSYARVFNTPRSVAEYKIAQADASVSYHFTTTFTGDLGVRYGSQQFSNAIRTGDTTQVMGFVGVQWMPLPARF